MLNLGQSIALLMPSARFPAPVKPPFLCFETIVLIRGKMILWRQCLSLFPHTPILLHYSTVDATASPAQTLQDAQFPSAFPCSSLNSPTPKKPNPGPTCPLPHTHPPPSVSRHQSFQSLTHPSPKMPPPKSPYTHTSTEGINLLLETGRAPLAWVQFFSVSQDWAQSLQQFTDSDVGCGYPHY